MIGFGFGYDDELPRGFQDADLEMRELEDAANEMRIREKRTVPTNRPTAIKTEETLEG